MSIISLEALRQGWLFLRKTHWIALGAIELFLPFYIVCLVSTNAWLGSSSYCGIILYFLTVYCILANLAVLMNLKVKKSAKDKPIFLLCDLDVDYDDACVKFRNRRNLDSSIIRLLRIWWYNFTQFCNCHYEYGLIATLGSTFMVTALVLAIIAYLLSENSSRDLYCSALILFSSGFVLLLTCHMQYMNPAVYSRRRYSYRPFDKKVKVPLKILGAKIVAAYLTGGFIHVIQLPIGLYLLTGESKAHSFIHENPKDDLLDLHKSLPESIICSAAHIILAAVKYAGIFLIYRTATMAYGKVKQNLLVTMELNWQRNLHAIQYIITRKVQDEGQEFSLDQLWARLEEKRTNMVPDEWNVFLYLSLPLWMPKRGFCQKQIIPRRERPHRLFGEKFAIRRNPLPEEEIPAEEQEIPAEEDNQE